MEFDESETWKIVRDKNIAANTNDKSKTINVDSNVVPNPPNRRKSNNPLFEITLRGLKVILKTLVLNLNTVKLCMHVILNVNGNWTRKNHLENCKKHP